MQQILTIKDKCFCKIIAICYFKQNIKIIIIKYKNHNYLLIFAKTYTIYLKTIITNNIKLKIVI